MQKFFLLFVKQFGIKCIIISLKKKKKTSEAVLCGVTRAPPNLWCNRLVGRRALLSRDRETGNGVSETNPSNPHGCVSRLVCLSR